MIERANKRISNQEIQSIKNTINMIFRSIRPVIYSEREKLEESSKEEISQIAYKAELAIQKILKDCLMKVSYNVPTEDEAHTLNAYQELLYNQALLMEGFPLKDPVAFSNKMCELMIKSSKQL